jgi:hypothetical protein
VWPTEAFGGGEKISVQGVRKEVNSIIHLTHGAARHRFCDRQNSSWKMHGKRGGMGCLRRVCDILSSISLSPSPVGCAILRKVVNLFRV